MDTLEADGAGVRTGHRQESAPRPGVHPRVPVGAEARPAGSRHTRRCRVRPTALRHDHDDVGDVPRRHPVQASRQAASRRRRGSRRGWAARVDAHARRRPRPTSRPVRRPGGAGRAGSSTAGVVRPGGRRPRASRSGSGAAPSRTRSWHRSRRCSSPARAARRADRGGAEQPRGRESRRGTVREHAVPRPLPRPPGATTSATTSSACGTTALGADPDRIGRGKRSGAHAESPRRDVRDAGTALPCRHVPPESPRSCRAWSSTRPRSSPRCRRWRSRSVRSTSARASPTPTDREELKDVAIAAIRDGRGNQYPPPHGLPLLREAIAQPPGALLRPRRRSRDRRGRRHRRVRGHPVRAARPGRRRRRGRRVRAVVRHLRGGHLAGPRASASACRCAGPDLRPDLAALRARQSPRAPGCMLLNSPHNPTGIVFTREELRRGRAGRDRARPAGHLRRGLRAPVVRRHRHVPIATLPGMWERTVTVGLRRQDVLLHRLEGRLGDGPGRPHRRRARRAPAPVLRLRRPVPVRDRARARAAGRVLRRASAPTSTAKRDLLGGGLADLGFGVDRSPRAPTSSRPTCAPLGYADGLAFCRDLPRRAGVVAIPHQVFCDDPRSARPSCAGRSASAPTS